MPAAAVVASAILEHHFGRDSVCFVICQKQILQVDMHEHIWLSEWSQRIELNLLERGIIIEILNLQTRECISLTDDDENCNKKISYLFYWRLLEKICRNQRTVCWIYAESASFIIINAVNIFIKRVLVCHRFCCPSHPSTISAAVLRVTVIAALTTVRTTTVTTIIGAADAATCDFKTWLYLPTLFIHLLEWIVACNYKIVLQKMPVACGFIDLLKTTFMNCNLWISTKNRFDVITLK